MDTTLNEVIEAFVAAPRRTPLGAAALCRLAFWRETLGERPIAGVTPEDVDGAIAALTARGRLRAVRGRPPVPKGEPLKGSTINRHLSDLGSLFRLARRLRVIPRGHVSPLTGIERLPEPIDPTRYLRPEEVERIIAMARLVDRRWGKMPALIRLAFTTGLRVGNLLDLRWADVDLQARTLSVTRTKNGHPIVSPIAPKAAEELRRLSRGEANDRVFGNKRGGRYNYRRIWDAACREAGLPGRNFHQLRHGAASALAAAGVNQALLMSILGHRTLGASSRYMHLSVDDKRAAVEAVFR